MFHQEGVIGFFRGKSYFVFKPLLMGTAHSWTPPLSGHLVMNPVSYKFKLKTA